MDLKIYSVQYLRGLAALLVLVAHALAGVDIGFARLGALGVALFFVISGFIMVLICGDGPFDRLDFYKRRILRVVPLYWIATLAVATVAIVAPTAFKNTEFSISQLVLSLLFIPHYRPNGEIVPLLKLGWTLNLEMFFYLSFGLLASMRAVPRAFVLSLVFASFALVGMLFAFHNALLHTYTMFDLVSFCMGMWVGIMMLRGRSLVGRPTLQASALAAAAMLIAAGFILSPSHINPLVTFVQASGSVLLLICGLSAEANIPRWRPATLMGDASYSIYLVHMYFVGAAVALLRHATPHAPKGVVVLAALVCGGAGGILAHLLIEKPIMRLLHRPRYRSPSVHAATIVPPDGYSPALMDEPIPLQS